MSHSSAANVCILKKTDLVKNVEINVPGSKSITNRVLLIAALADGKSLIQRPLFSEDTHAMLACLASLGVSTRQTDDGHVEVLGTGKLTQPEDALFVENAGTAARFLTAAAALVGGEVELDGNHYMRKRPIAPLLDALETLGCQITSANGYMPLTVANISQPARDITENGTPPTVEIDASLSSQYTSALLLIAPMLTNGLDLRLSGSGKIDAAGYLDVTLDTMAAFGVTPSQQSPGRWVFEPGQYTAREFAVEPDYSACTYFWAAQALGATGLSIAGCDTDNTRQPDAKSKASIEQFPDMNEVIDGSQMQDSIPTLAVLAAFNNKPVRFTGIANLRVKECDRIDAIAQGLNRIQPGLASVEGDDLIVSGAFKPDPDAAPAEIDSFDDHRIAMAFALTALKGCNIAITNPRCVGKTFPDYWKELARIGVQAQDAVTQQPL